MKPIAFLGFFKYLFLSIFIAYILIHAIFIGLNNHDITLTLLEIGKEVFGTVVNIQNSALEIINGKSSFFNLWSFYSAIYMTWAWIRIFGWICKKILIMDDSKSVQSTIGGIIFFIIFQIVYLALTRQNLNIIWTAWIDVYHAINFKITGINSMPIYPDINLNLTENCSQEVCRVVY